LRARRTRTSTSDRGSAFREKCVNALLVVTAPCVFFVVAELVLALCGVRPILYDEDPYVGFSSYIPLFVEETMPDGTGVMVTAKNKLKIFNAQRFAKDKPAGTYRIFCPGGSTPLGKPYDDMTSFCGWLRAMLPKADPSRQWEVINAGGISYASYRVAMLMEELIRYEPDLFIIYSGHNEFLEERTYGRIKEMPRALRELAALVSRTRVGAVVKRAVDVLRERAGGTADTRELLGGEVLTILDQSVGPKAYHRDDELRNQVLEHFRFNLTRMIDIARSVGAKVVLITPASNLRHCSPYKSEHRDGLSDADLKCWEALFHRAEGARAAGEWDEALAALDEALRIDDRYAHLHYLRGEVLWDLKRYGDAKAAFMRARDEDICPLRALTPMRGIVAEVAGDRDVPLVDFVGLVEGRSDHAVPGESLFFGHVHPTIEAHRQLALALLEVMIEQGVVQPISTWGDAAIAGVKRDVEGRLDRKAHGIALRNLARVLGWAGKNEEARKVALQAAEMAPADAEAYYLVGVNAENLGRSREAKRYYRQAQQLNLHEDISQFRQVLEGRPDDAATHYKLGVALSMTGQSGGLKHLREAVGLKPDFLAPLTGMVWYLAAHPDAEVRDASQAIELAELAAELTHYRSEKVLDALAAAYAAAGQFDDAVRTAEQAVARARARGDRRAGDIQRRLALYEQQKPYRDVRLRQVELLR